MGGVLLNLCACAALGRPLLTFSVHAYETESIVEPR